MPKRVAVVGAGPSGLAALKELLDEGHQPTCFEQAAGLGGVFRFDEDAGVLYDSCRLTSSGLLTAFSDFPVPGDRIEQLTTGEYVDYLERYCEAFGLDRHIRFGTTVESVTPCHGGGWRVRAADADGRPSDERFDAVAVCSGLHQHRHCPHFPGEETFSGQILHSADYRRPHQFAGKRVLIVGAGESGADIVAEVADHAAETMLSLRRGVAVLPRKVRGHPNDHFTCRIGNSAAHWVFQTRNPEDNGKRKVYRTVFFPFALLDKCLEGLAGLVDRLRAFRPLLSVGRLGRGALTETRTSLRTRRLIKQLVEESGGTPHEQFGTKSDDFVKAMAAGRCRRSGPIARFEGRRVVFEDGSQFEPDVVILCTGFEVEVPFLHEQQAQASRYLHTFVPSIGASLAFIGFVRPAFGAIPPIAELQARWFALLVSGKAELPSDADMQASIEQLAAFRRSYFRAVRGRLDYLVDFTSICDQLAAMVGCKPTREAIRRESLRFRVRFYAGPFVAAQYRLLGTARQARDREACNHLPAGRPSS